MKLIHLLLGNVFIFGLPASFALVKFTVGIRALNALYGKYIYLHDLKYRSYGKHQARFDYRIMSHFPKAI